MDGLGGWVSGRCWVLRCLGEIIRRRAFRVQIWSLKVVGVGHEETALFYAGSERIAL